jgi:hypothetical protein
MKIEKMMMIKLFKIHLKEKVLINEFLDLKIIFINTFLLFLLYIISSYIIKNIKYFYGLVGITSKFYKEISLLY